jgi:hypothetical protein
MLKKLLALDDLEGYAIRGFIEVFEVDEAGIRGKSHGAFWDAIHAAGYVDLQPNADNLHIRRIFIIFHVHEARTSSSDDNVQGLIISGDTIQIDDEESTINEILRGALAKLTAPEIAIIKSRSRDI